MLGIFILIVVNLALGYALAFYLHRQQLLPAGIDQSPTTTTIPLVGGNRAAPPKPTAEQAAAPPEIEQSKAAPNEPIEPPAAPELKSAPPEPQAAAIQPDAPAAEATPIVPTSAPTEKPQAGVDEPVTSLPTALEPAVALKAPSPAVSDAVSSFQRELNRYRFGLESLDDQMRKHSIAPEVEHVKTCVDQFESLTDVYLEQCRQSQQALTAEATNDLATATCLAAAEMQEAAIAATRAELTTAAGLVDAAASCREFLLATGRLDQANQSFDEQLVRTQNDWSTAAEAVEADAENTTVAKGQSANNDTEGLESAILEFIASLPDRTKKFNIALAAIDQLQSINQKQGRVVSDRITQNIAQTFITLSPHSTLATDMARQQILFFQADGTARETTQVVEQVRLRIAGAKFLHDAKPVPVSLSCGVAEATGEEAPEAIVGRLQSMLAEAIRYGSNCTFMQEGEQSAPAVPPTNIKIEKRMIEV